LTRQADATRQSLIAAGLAVFAERGFEAGSVRLITQRAKANQAAINYHFGGKDGLYREVLRAALRAFEDEGAAGAKAADGLGRAEALRRFVGLQLVPLLHRDRFSRYVRLFAWEHISPTKVFADFVASEKLPLLAAAGRLVRRYLPESASSEEVAVTTVWLIQQPAIFVRDQERLARPPLGLAIDRAFVERLEGYLTVLIDGALSARAALG
jgi:AcrR family transcriptional regulator